jgi:hypothetical protein
VSYVTVLEIYPHVTAPETIILVLCQTHLLFSSLHTSVHHSLPSVSIGDAFRFITMISSSFVMEGSKLSTASLAEAKAEVTCAHFLLS